MSKVDRITNTANPAISNEGNPFFPVFGFGVLFKSEKFYDNSLFEQGLIHHQIL